MTDSIVLSGTFADLKSVKTRSIVQMIIELPIEQAAQIVAEFGYPQPGKEVSVAVARLNERSAIAKPDAPLLDKPAKLKSYAQKIGLLCATPSFRKFLGEKFEDDAPVETAEQAASIIRLTCKVASRRDILEDTLAGETWHNLQIEYNNWLYRL